jgi:riboflavin kinase / FMN adenylyltransferase
MQVFRHPNEIPPSFGSTVVSIGNFDGVHLGHQFILDRLRRSAAERSAKSVAVTFDPHPLRLLRPESCPRLITPLETKLELLRGEGVDAVLVLPFQPELSRMRAAEFVMAIVYGALRAVEVHEGANFRFGHRAEGGVAELGKLGRELGFDVVIHGACEKRGFTVSSSKIRDLIAQGEVSTARALLGHVFFVDSTPARGRGIGGRLTVPTINLAPYDELLPANGVYVTRLRIAGEWFDAVTNVGNRPTFGADSFAVESYLLDFREIPMDEETPLRLMFCRRLREERRWESPAALKEQIMRDVARAKRYLQLRRVFAKNSLDSEPAQISPAGTAENQF